MRKKKFGKRAVTMTAAVIIILVVTVITAFADSYHYDIPANQWDGIHTKKATTARMSFNTRPSLGDGGVWLHVKGPGVPETSTFFPTQTSRSPLVINTTVNSSYDYRLKAGSTDVVGYLYIYNIN
jgi:hypothetical protein